MHASHRETIKAYAGISAARIRPAQGWLLGSLGALRTVTSGRPAEIQRHSK
jgi:hypothetical protein